MPVFHEGDGRWHGVLCANCGWELYSSLPRTSGTVNWYHISNTTCSKAEPSAEDAKAIKARNTHGYHLTEQQGKAVQEVLRRYIDEQAALRESLQILGEETGQVQKDIDYIEGLVKLFD